MKKTRKIRKTHKKRKKYKKRKKTRHYNKRRRRKTRRRHKRSRGRGGLSVGMNTVNLQRKAIHGYNKDEMVRQKDKESINWEKGDGRCYITGKKFGLRLWEHHCRTCGKPVSDKVSKNQQQIYRWALYKTQGSKNAFRECDICFKKENEAINDVMDSGKTREIAIASLRRAMFPARKYSKNRMEMIKNARYRYPPRLPSSQEIKNAKKFQDDEETQKYVGPNWTVRKRINEIYPPPKKEEEQETDMMGLSVIAHKAGLNAASTRPKSRENRSLSRAELMEKAKRHTKKIGNNLPTAIPVFPEAEVVERGNRL